MRARLIGGLSVVAFVVGAVGVAPSVSLAASVDDYVVVETDGDVVVRALTPAQADAVAARDGVRMVAPDQPMSLVADAADAGDGLDAPVGAAAGDPIPGRWIVTFKSQAAAGAAAAAYANSVRATFTQAVNGFVAELSAAEAGELARDPDVLVIEQDRVITIDATQDGATWGLDRLDQRSLPLTGRYEYTRTGVGVTAYIVDTGVAASHSEFAGRMAAGYTSIVDGRGTEDCHGHGTHVAGTVAGTTWGVAKAATVVPVRVLNCYGSGSWSGVVAGLDWIVGHHVAGVPAVANMSLGGGLSSTVNAAVARASADGVTVVVAAGNDNANACNYSPAAERSAITVGATTSTDARAPFSNWGTCLDLFAPGASIRSAYPWSAGVPSSTGSTTMSGTSMASPHVAGVAALYLEGNRTASPATVASALAASASAGRVTLPGTGSPNLLAYSTSFDPAPPLPPNVPSSLRATTDDTRSTLTWVAPTDGGSAVTDYIVEYSTNQGTSWTTHADGVSTATSTTVTGLTNGVVHWFRVRAVNSVGTSDPSAIAVATPSGPTRPSAPVSLTATPGVEQVVLRWSAPSSDGRSPVTDYLIEWNTDGGSNWNWFNDGNSAATTATMTGLTAGTSYYFRVAAINAVGTGGVSNVAMATPWSLAAPSAPRSVTAEARVTSIGVGWATPSTMGGGVITSYLVDWSTNAGATWNGQVSVTSTTRFAVLSNLAPGTAHTVRVRAVNQYGTGVGATAVATPLAPQPPTAPRSVSVVVGYEQLSVSWSRPALSGSTAITGYYVDWSTDSGSTWLRGSLVSGGLRWQTLNGLTGGLSHRIRVVAVNSVGESAPSDVVTATPLARQAPSAPRSLYGFVSGSTAVLSWSSPSVNGGSPITGYDVWRSDDSGATWTLAGSSTASVRSARVTNLAAGTTYRFRVTAKNVLGSGVPSNVVSLMVRGFGTPNPPASVQAVVDGTTVSVTWSAVTSSYAPVTDYVVEWSSNFSSTWNIWPDGVSTSTSAVLADLAPDVPVSIRIRAVNSFGTGPASGAVTVTPVSAPTVPGAPLSAVAVAGDGRATVSWIAPTSNGGATITSYTVTAAPGGATCQTAALTCTVTGLVNGTAHTFTVTATNSAGTGPASEPSDPVTPNTGTASPVTALSWGLDRVDQRALPLDSTISRMGTGSGVDVYVVDTGVYAGHTDLAGRVASGYTSILDGNGTHDCNGHGTHVAGTIAGTRYGLATGATIQPVRVLDCGGSGSTSSVVAGINWAIQHHVAGQPAVLNMSLGGWYDAVLNDAVARAVADGITVVVAAGNSSQDACNFSPASAPSAITVGSTDVYDSRSSFSNFGGCLDVFAPGSNIVSLGTSSSTATRTLSGTSMASPHVAGVAAQILGVTRSLTPVQVASTISSDATVGAVGSVGVNSPNRLLYARPPGATGSTEVDDDGADDSVFSFAYGSDIMTPPTRDAGTAPVAAPVTAPAAPSTSAPAPVTATPVRASESTGAFAAPPGVSIASVTRKGKNLLVRVVATPGARVVLFRNGKQVAAGSRTVFTVPVGRAVSHKFRAVATVGATRVSSASVSVRISGAGLR